MQPDQRVCSQLQIATLSSTEKQCLVLGSPKNYHFEIHATTNVSTFLFQIL